MLRRARVIFIWVYFNQVSGTRGGGATLCQLPVIQVGRPSRRRLMKSLALPKLLFANEVNCHWRLTFLMVSPANESFGRTHGFLRKAETVVDGVSCLLTGRPLCLAPPPGGDWHSGRISSSVSSTPGRHARSVISRIAATHSDAPDSHF